MSPESIPDTTWEVTPRVPRADMSLDELAAEAKTLVDDFFKTAERLPHWGIVLRRIRLAAMREKFDSWLEDLTTVSDKSIK
jgi:hypothetical protein